MITGTVNCAYKTCVTAVDVELKEENEQLVTKLPKGWTMFWVERPSGKHEDVALCEHCADSFLADTGHPKLKKRTEKKAKT